MTKTIFITGASSGIGFAAAQLFAAKGWNVVATMRDTKGSELKGKNILVTTLDVRDEDSIAKALKAAIKKFGQIDVLLNNAGFSLFGVFESLPAEKIEEQFAVNVTGVMNVTRALLPLMREKGSATIINISSRAGIIGMPLNALYCASKFALEGFSEALSYELATQGIAVKLVVPSGGVTATKFSERMVKDKGVDIPPSYNDFVAKIGGIYGAMQTHRKTTAGDVAAVIFTAATDGKQQLRYYTVEDVGGFLRVKREKDDEEYIGFMRQKFLSE